LQGIFNSLAPERQGLFLKIIQERAEQKKALEDKQKKLDTEAAAIAPTLAAIPRGDGLCWPIVQIARTVLTLALRSRRARLALVRGATVSCSEPLTLFLSLTGERRGPGWHTV
jgi:hypothetical protein